MIKITEHKISFFDDTETVIIPVVQGDTGRVLKFTPTDATLSAGYTATWFVGKPSGEAVYYTATITGNSVVCELTAQALAEKGESYLSVRVYDSNEKVVSAFRVVLKVQESPVDAIESTTETNVFDQTIENAKQEIGQILDTTLSVQNKAAEAKATGDAIKAAFNKIATPHDEEKFYSYGDVCNYGGKVYVCNAPSGTIIQGDFIESEWIEVSSVGDVVSQAMRKINSSIAYEHSTSDTYNTGDLCFKYNTLYRCKEDGVTGAWNYSKWQAVSLPDIIEDQMVSISEDDEGFLVIDIGGS